MSDEWRVIGLAESGISAMLPPRKFLVEHKRTGERRVVLAYDRDSVGSAIERGKWVD